MDLGPTDRRVAAALAAGLPLVSRPYLALAEALGLPEAEVIARARRLLETGAVKRLGVVVHHRALGYRANAMVVWDVPDDRVRAVGRALATLPFVTLCYRRPRRPPAWRYNLFCMIHGRERAAVEAQIARAARACAIEDLPCAVLFSSRRFKQCGARYAAPGNDPSEAVEGAA